MYCRYRWRICGPHEIVQASRDGYSESDVCTYNVSAMAGPWELLQDCGESDVYTYNVSAMAGPWELLQDCSENNF